MKVQSSTYYKTHGIIIHIIYTYIMVVYLSECAFFQNMRK